VHYGLTFGSIMGYYDLSVSRARDPLIAITVFAAIGVLTTALRLKSRQMRQISLEIDDFLMLGALVSATSTLCSLNYAHTS
jgi:hypothetical protein